MDRFQSGYFLITHGIISPCNVQRSPYRGVVIRIGCRWLSHPAIRTASLSLPVAALILGISFVQVSANEPVNVKVPSDPKKWSAVQAIDIHAHIGSFKGFEMGRQALIANVKRFGIRMALVSNVDGAELPGITANMGEAKANEETEKLVLSDPQHFRGLIWVTPHSAKIEIAKHFIDMRLNDSDKPVFVGMKFHPEFDHYWADDNTVDPYLDLCAKNKLVAVFHCGAPGTKSEPERIYKAAKRHPKVPVVLYHMGFNSDHLDAISTVAQSIKNKDADLYVDTAQCSPSAVIAAVKRLGANRVMFGTDATYYGSEHYHHYDELLDKLREALSPHDFALVMHDNAARLFKL